MSVHLLGMLFRTTFKCSPRALFTYFQTPSDTVFIFRFTSTLSAFEVVTVNALYKSLTYLNSVDRIS